MKIKGGDIAFLLCYINKIIFSLFIILTDCFAAINFLCALRSLGMRLTQAFYLLIIIALNYSIVTLHDSYMVILLSSRWRVINWWSGLSAGDGIKFNLLCVMDSCWRLPKEKHKQINFPTNLHLNWLPQANNLMSVVDAELV